VGTEREKKKEKRKKGEKEGDFAAGLLDCYLPVSISCPRGRFKRRKGGRKKKNKKNAAIKKTKAGGLRTNVNF